MTPGLPVQIAYVAAVIAIPAAVISLLAIACVNRRATRLFVYSVLLVTCVAAMAVAIAVRWLYPDSDRPSIWHDVLGAFLSWAPLFLLPSAFVWACVKGSISRGWIPILATLGVVVSLPIGFILGVLVQ